MREFKKPNLNAPRYRPEVHSIMNKEFFDSFKKKYPKYKNLDDKELNSLIINIKYEIYLKREFDKIEKLTSQTLK